MKLLSQINIQRITGTASIELVFGDLSSIPVEHAADILVMAAVPGNYIGLKGSLIYFLEQKGLSVGALSHDKETDLRKQLNCWLSKPLAGAEQQKFNIKRILCFEPGEKINEPAEVVSNIFRCINTFVFDVENNVVIMPIIGTGKQKVPMQKMLPALLAASSFWLKNGLPLKCIKLAVHRDEQAEEALALFNKFQIDLWDNLVKPVIPPAPSISPQADDPFGSRGKKEPGEQAPKPSPVPVKKSYDYFLSYAHKHAKEVQYFVDELQNKNKGVSIFFDKESIRAGGLWIQQISSAIQQSDKVLVFLSPDYDNSPVCWDEFQCAKLMEYNRKKNIIQTVYLYGHKETEMPLIMGIYSYIDCREADSEKIKSCIQQLTR